MLLQLGNYSNEILDWFIYIGRFYIKVRYIIWYFHDFLNFTSPNNAETFMAALQEKVSKESRYQIKKGYNIEQEGSQNPANLLTFPLSMQVLFYLFIWRTSDSKMH